MRRATENQVNTRTLTEYFSPRSKVKDLTLQQCPPPHFASHFLQETPMKPSQVPNKLPHTPPRRVLPLQSPNVCHNDRLVPPQHPHHHLGPIYSSGFGPGSPNNIGSSANRLHPTPRDRLGPLRHSAQPPGSSCTWHVPVSPTNSGTTANRPQPSSPSNFHPASSQFMKDLSNHSPSSHIRRDQVTESKVTLSFSGSKNVTTQRQESNKDEQHKRIPSSEKLIPVDSNHSSQKRSREFEDDDRSAKKQCVQGENFCKAQTLKPTVGKSLSFPVVSQSSSGHSSVLELSPKTTDSPLCTEPACGQLTYLELSSASKPTQSSCASLSLNPCIKRRPSMGAKQFYVSSPQNHTLKLIELRSPSSSGEDSLKKSEENNKRDESRSLLSSEVPQKNTCTSLHFQLSSHKSGPTQRSTSVLPVKTMSRGNQVEESTKWDNSTPKLASKPNSGSLSCRTTERSKTARPRRPVAIADDIDELFTPDPMTYVISPAHKNAKPKTDVGLIKSSTSDKSSSRTVSSSSTVTGSLCHKTQNLTVTGSPHAVDTKVSSSSSPCHLQVSSPTVALERVKLENLKSFCPKDSKLENSPEVTSSGRMLKDESVKCDEKQASLLPKTVRPCTLETDTAASSLLERQASDWVSKKLNEEDPIDVELDLGLSFALDLDLTQSSHSSGEEQLLSLQEMMERATKPPDTPEKGAFSEHSTPENQPLPSTTKSGIYKNNLDQMLKEINTNKRAKEIEAQLLTACKEDLLRIAEYEEAEENREEGISTEQQEFLQRYSLMSNAIREVPPGEAVFNLEKFGRIFNHDTLQLRQCMVNPLGTPQKTLLWSSPAQLKLHVNIGLFQEAYDSHSPCPAQVTRFLFKMMSVHNERMVSEKILQALCDIACTAAYQIVKNGSQKFKVWVPGLADVALVLMNMGVAFLTLFPFENLQPPFTEGDLLEDIYIKSESPASNKEQRTFPEHNYNNILKYLSYCMALCPLAYSDDELLLLLTVVGRVSLDTRLILLPSVELYPLQYKIVNNFRDWNTMLPRICLALTDLTDDHHNMCLLVQLLPDNKRGKCLRQHLSLSMISKLLDGNCTYKPTEEEIQLSELRLYLRRMQPSTLLRGMLSSSSRSERDKEDMITLDQQSYYLCYSLLTLANEASNFQVFPVHQKEQLQFLCSELETHVKCDIRENEKCLYRSKVKDLVARISTKWQILLLRTRPLNDKLYDYWQPLTVDTLTSSQEEQEIDNRDDEEGLVMEEDEDAETSGTEENEVVMIAEDEEKELGEDTMYDRNETKDDTMPEEMEGDYTVDDTNETEEATNKEMPEMEPKVMDEQIEAENTERTEIETENLVETRESQHDQVAACDLVS